MKLSSKMAYDSADEMIFGSCRSPRTTRRGLRIGSGMVIPEIVVHPRPGSEATLKDLIREYERAYEEALTRCVSIGIPQVCLEVEHVIQMTQKPDWGEEIASAIAALTDSYRERYGITAACKFTIADVRRPALCHMRESERTEEVLDAFRRNAPFADILAIESLGGKEIFDHCIIRNDIKGMLFAQAVLGGRDMEWLWPRIVEIARDKGSLPGGDTSCAHANTAMFMAGGYLSRQIPHTLAALSRAISAGNTLVAYECGATGPGKNCAYENPIIKAVTGVSISCEGKSSACAHSDFCGNLIGAVCDLWSNEAVEFHSMFGGTSAAVFTEILGYDTALMNSSINLGLEHQLKTSMIHSDRLRDPQSYILSPDIAWIIGKTLTENSESYYARARAAALKSGELILEEPQLALTEYEKSALTGYLKILENLPGDQENFIDLCLHDYAGIKGFRKESYGFD